MCQAFQVILHGDEGQRRTDAIIEDPSVTDRIEFMLLHVLGELFIRYCRSTSIFHYYIQIIYLVSMLVSLPKGSVGDLYAPVNIQIAGIYPIIVVLLVNHERSLEYTVFVNSGAISATGLGRSTRPAANTNKTLSSLAFRSNPNIRERTQTHTGASTGTGIGESVQSNFG